MAFCDACDYRPGAHPEGRHMGSEGEISTYRQASVGRNESFRSPAPGFPYACAPARRDETALGHNG